MRSLVKLVLLMSLAGAVGVPCLAAPPGWIAEPPGADAESAWFTGVGTSGTGDATEAERIARDDLVEGILRYLGMETTAGTSGEAKASVDEYRAGLRDQLAREDASPVTGLAVTDRYVEEAMAGVTVHLLARYATADLVAAKERLEVLLRGTEAGAESEGDALVRAGRLYEAALKYLEAAAEAAASDADDAAVRFTRAMDEARTALERISLFKLNDNLSTAAGTAFAEPFRVKAVGGAKAADPPVPEVTLTVSWAVWGTGERQAASARLMTAEDGVAAFVHPAPDFVGAETVTMAVDITSPLSGFGDLTKDQQGMVDGIADLVARKQVTFSLESYSPARELESAIAVAALDADGEPLPGQEFAAGILKALSGAAFRVTALAMDPAAVAGSEDAEIVSAASAQAGATTRRIIFGIARVEGIETVGDTVVAKVSGIVKVADVKTGTVLLTVSRARSAEASTPAAAVSAALAGLGEEVGQEIVSRLR